MAVEAPKRPGTRGPISEGPRPPGAVIDHLFRWLTLGAGLMVLVILVLIVYSTTKQALPWFRSEGFGAIFGKHWIPAGKNVEFGALPLICGTLLVSAIALALAVPISIGIALFVTEVAPRWLRKPVIYVIDLLAVIPSVVYGLWALAVLVQPALDAYTSVQDAVANIPVLKTIFSGDPASGRSFMTAGIVVAIMVTPIITSLTREVFATVPTSQKEAALAMGATRWEMIRGAVFPHSRSGVVAAVLIGLGRAMGETIAVALLIGSSPRITARVFSSGDAMAAIIANQFNEATGTWRSALIGLGVVLFFITIVIGVIARAVVHASERRMAGT
jgi:phosphate transport system permease protein